MKRRFVTGLLTASVALTPLPALADNAFVGGLVGGIIGSAIANQPQKKVYRAPAKKTYKSSSANSAQRQQNRDTQTALNYFGFDAGSVDGVMGSRSRSAISAYQAHMGYSPTGQITQYERDFLIGSYHRAQAGGPTTAQMIASSPMGVKGLLTAYRDEQMNGSGNLATASIGGHYGLPSVVAAAVNEIAKSSDPTAEQLVQRHGFIQLADINGDGRTDYLIDTSVTGSAFWCSAQSCAVRVFASTPDGYERNDFQAFNVTPAMFTCQRGTCAKTGDGGTMTAASPGMPAPQLPPQTQMAAMSGAGVAPPVASAQPVVPSTAPVAAQPASPALPNFFGAAPVEASLASHCNTVSLVTSTNGGYITADTLTDPVVAMDEQMCLTRTYAIARGEELMAQVAGATPQQIAAQCASFGELLKENVAAVSLQPREEVLQGVGQFLLSTGMSPAQLEKTAQICLASGYKTDDLDTAMAAALMLVSLGQAPYAELLGHHLSQGFGASKRLDLAVSWYGQALDALDGGAVPVFASGQPERAGLLRKASLMLGGNAAVQTAPEGMVTKAATLPVFTIEN
ncbi:peptidoglycan-binding domain-containing protein [Salipiger abyssi]|uniref:peptidoglycan-binding domain-containing protein n=1 Tax=Salipiger abyssi TaxID=1250539 RepID=UPI001A8DC459|nr:peptidoglycan-binding protein [Salipiger abyssi]MBN9888440.1 peptidoglycan-binding protein [Salipiger abyssi]